MNAIFIELSDKTVYLAKLEPKLPSEQPLTDKDKVILDLHKQIEELKSNVNNVVSDGVIKSKIMELYIVRFQMQKKVNIVEAVKFLEPQTDEQINEYFENVCGGVYKWWRE